MPSATASPSNPLDVVLHVGSGETAASSIQQFMQRNRSRLADLGYLYPHTPGPKRHFRFGLFIQPDDVLGETPTWHRHQFSSPDAFRDEFRRRLFAEINRSGLSRVVLSDDALYGTSDKALRNLHKFADEAVGKLRLVVYLRRQDDHLAIRYQQLVKLGETRRLADRIKEVELTPTYDYYKRLLTWERLVEPDEFVVRRFERDSFADRSLYQDFFAAAGIDARAETLEQVEQASERLDAESVEFLRILNIFRVENEQTADLAGNNKALATRLAEASTGPTLTAPAEFMTLWARSNEDVARDFLRDETGQLFRMPQSIGSTTTEQRLDPTRVDHYLALTDLPEQVHAPLRALVEREAKEPLGSDPVTKRVPRGLHVGINAAPTSRFRKQLDIVLHIGMGKTGTSSIQFLLRDNRKRLSELGVLFPATPGVSRHDRLGLFAKPDEELRGSIEWARQKYSDPARFRDAFRRRLFSEIETSGLDRVLLTDEILFGSSEATLRRLGQFTDRIAKSTRVVAYLRRQDDHMVSRYQQTVKVGGVLRLGEWAGEDMSGLYDYYARLRRHEQLLAPTELMVRRYERECFVNGSLYQDFLDAAGIDVRADELVQGPDRNDSLDAESVEFLRLLNLYRVEYEGATPRLIDNRRLAAQLAEVSDGPVLSLPASWLDEFMTQWGETNELVARRFLGDESGQLFATARKSDNVTTDQHLDPGRLDHFLTMLELPEQMHAPLRRVVEREANAH